MSSPAASAISIVAPSRVPIVSAPFIMNFMLLVPLASYPAVEICSDRSLAGISRWARVTLYSGRNRTLSRPRTAGSASITAATLLIRWMISLARWYAGAALPAKKTVRGGTSSPGSSRRRL